MRHPMKFILFETNGLIELVFFFSKINVKGPGQNKLINFSSNVFILQFFLTSFIFLK